MNTLKTNVSRLPVKARIGRRSSSTIKLSDLSEKFLNTTRIIESGRVNKQNRNIVSRSGNLLRVKRENILKTVKNLEMKSFRNNGRNKVMQTSNRSRRKVQFDDREGSLKIITDSDNSMEKEYYTFKNNFRNASLVSTPIVEEQTFSPIHNNSRNYPPNLMDVKINFTDHVQNKNVYDEELRALERQRLKDEMYYEEHWRLEEEQRKIEAERENLYMYRKKLEKEKQDFEILKKIVEEQEEMNRNMSNGREINNKSVDDFDCNSSRMKQKNIRNRPQIQKSRERFSKPVSNSNYESKKRFDLFIDNSSKRYENNNLNSLSSRMPTDGLLDFMLNENSTSRVNERGGYSNPRDRRGGKPRTRSGGGARNRNSYIGDEEGKKNKDFDETKRDTGGAEWRRGSSTKSGEENKNLGLTSKVKETRKDDGEKSCKENRSTIGGGGGGKKNEAFDLNSEVNETRRDDRGEIYRKNSSNRQAERNKKEKIDLNSKVNETRRDGKGKIYKENPSTKSGGGKENVSFESNSEVNETRKDGRGEICRENSNNKLEEENKNKKNYLNTKVSETRRDGEGKRCKENSSIVGGGGKKNKDFDDFNSKVSETTSDEGEVKCRENSSTGSEQQTERGKENEDHDLNSKINETKRDDEVEGSRENPSTEQCGGNKNKDLNKTKKDKITGDSQACSSKANDSFSLIDYMLDKISKSSPSSNHKDSFNKSNRNYKNILDGTSGGQKYKNTDRNTSELSRGNMTSNGNRNLNLESGYQLSMGYKPVKEYTPYNERTEYRSINTINSYQNSFANPYYDANSQGRINRNISENFERLCSLNNQGRYKAVSFPTGFEADGFRFEGYGSHVIDVQNSTPSNITSLNAEGYGSHVIDVQNSRTSLSGGAFPRNPSSNFVQNQTNSYEKSVSFGNETESPSSENFLAARHLANKARIGSDSVINVAVKKLQRKRMSVQHELTLLLRKEKECQRYSKELQPSQVVIKEKLQGHILRINKELSILCNR